MIAQGFGFTRDFLKERNNSAYFRLKKIPCEFKEQARARHPGEKCGLAIARFQPKIHNCFDCLPDINL
jgi:hypothetical protein